MDNSRFSAMALLVCLLTVSAAADDSTLRWLEDGGDAGAAGRLALQLKQSGSDIPEWLMSAAFPDPDDGGSQREGGDHPADAYPIPSLPFTDSGSTTGKADDTGVYNAASLVCGWNGYFDPARTGDGGDVFYSLRLERPMRLEISLCGSSFDTSLGLFQDLGGATGNLLAGNEDACGTSGDGLVSVLNSCLLPAGDYLIAVDGYWFNSGAYSLSVRETPGTGGPDGFGYIWTSSLDPDGPVFQWTDIRTTGTAVPLLDNNSAGPFVPGFVIPFYGSNYGQFHISSNGMVNLLSGSNSTINQVLPNPSPPNGMVALFWDNLDPASVLSGDVYYLIDTPGGRATIQFTDIITVGRTVPQTFQLVIEASGNLLLQYLDIDEGNSGLTIGMENATGTQGFTAYAFGQGLTLQDSLAVAVTFPVGDILRPVIDHHFAGDTDQAGVPLPVSADITDAQSGVASATLHFRSEGGAFTAIPMTAGLPPLYTAEIPPQAGGTTVEYYFTATDNAVPANTRTSPTWSFRVLDFALPPTGLQASDGAFDHVTLNWSAPDWQGAGRDFLYYRVFRDSMLLGTTTDTAWTDVPPQAGHPYFYEVTALLDAGESDPASDTGYFIDRPTSGGPDGYGITWTNSLDPDGPVFQWTDISTTGTLATLGGFGFTTVPIDIGFPFPLYGQTHTTTYVSGKGMLTFLSGSGNWINQNLPSGEGPNQLVAPFWDNLNPGSVTHPGWIRTRSETNPARFIVQYHVIRLDGTEYLDFQVILHPDGRVLMNYLAVEAAGSESATVGMENGLGNQGITASFNGSGGRLADGLSYRFINPLGDLLPPTLSHTPLPATELPGPFTVNATVLDAGAGVGQVVLEWRLDGGPWVPVGMTPGPAGVYSGVLPSPGGPATVEYRLTATDASPAANTATSAVYTFRVGTSWAPVGLVASDGYPDHVMLQWQQPAPPEARTLLEYRIYRNGQQVGSTTSTQAVDIPPVAGTAYTYTVAASHDNGLSAHSAPDTGFWLARPTEGGPDAFGHVWLNSDDPSGFVTYSWTDISGNPAAVALAPGCDGSVAVAIGFPFPFYEGLYDTLRVGADGVLAFGSAVPSGQNLPLPDPTAPDNLIAVLWEDLDPSLGGTVHVLHDVAENRFRVQWTGIPVAGTPWVTRTFQAMLQPNGEIHLYYRDLGDIPAGASVGIEDGTGTDGITVHADGTGGRLGSQLAVRLRPPLPCPVPDYISLLLLPEYGVASLYWSAVPDAAGYAVYTSPFGYGPWTLQEEVYGPPWLDFQAFTGGPRFYRVSAVCP